MSNVTQYLPCYGNFMPCGSCLRYAYCYSLNLKDGKALLKNCIPCLNCQNSDGCVTQTLKNIIKAGFK